MSFTKEMENHLKSMGWFPNRKISTYDEFMEKYNYPEFIREFIRKYGGIKILELREKKDSNVVNTISLSITDSEGMDSESVANGCSSNIGRKLYVIGLFSPQNCDIAVDSSGAVYLLGEECQCISNDIFKGVEAVVRIDVGGGIELDSTDSTSGKWFDWHGNLVDFNTYEFKYRTF